MGFGPFFLPAFGGLGLGFRVRGGRVQGLRFRVQGFGLSLSMKLTLTPAAEAKPETPNH